MGQHPERELATGRITRGRRQGQDFLETRLSFREIAAVVPDAGQGGSKVDCSFEIVQLNPPAQGPPQIVMLAFQLIELFCCGSHGGMWNQPFRA